MTAPAAQDRDAPQKASPWVIALVIAIVMIDSMGIGIIIPVTPALLLDVLPEATLAEAAIWGGVLTSLYAAMQFLFGPALGALSDQVGRKPVLILSLFCDGHILPHHGFC